jgi:ribose transport system substrate-binding protein
MRRKRMQTKYEKISIVVLLLLAVSLSALQGCAPASPPPEPTSPPAPEPTATSAASEPTAEPTVPTAEPTAAGNEDLNQLLMKLFGRTEDLDPFVVEALSYAAEPYSQEEKDLAIKCFQEDGCETGRGTMTVAFANGYTDNSWMQEVTMNWILQALRYPEVKQLVITRARGDQAKALSDLRALAVQQPDIVVSLQVVAEAAVPVYRDMIAAGTTVVGFNAPTGGEIGVDISGEVLIPFAGASIGEIIAEELGGEGKVALILGPAGFPPEVGCVDDMMAVLEQHPGIEVLPSVNTDWTQETVLQATASLLSRYPQIDAVYQSFGDSHRGAVRAYHQANRPLDGVTVHHNATNGYLGDWVQENNPNWRLYATSGQQFGSRVTLHMAMELAKGNDPPTMLMMPFLFFKVKVDDYDPSLPESLNPYSAVPTDVIREMFGE